MTAVTALLCIFGLGALLIGRVSAGEQCNSCQVSYCNCAHHTHTETATHIIVKLLALSAIEVLQLIQSTR